MNIYESGTACHDCGATLNSEAEIEHRQCDDCAQNCYVPPLRRPFTRAPYPTWYRRSPIAIFMPWRNLGCLGIRVWEVYSDVYRVYRFPWFGWFVRVRGGQRHYPLIHVRRFYHRGSRAVVNAWCRFWCWLSDHTGSGRINDLVIRVTEKVTPNNW